MSDEPTPEPPAGVRAETSARVPGHALVAGGSVYFPTGAPVAGGRWWTPRFDWWSGRGACTCGERSPVLDTNADRKRWHRAHKAQVLAEQEAR